MNETLSILGKVREHYLSKYCSVLEKFFEQNKPGSPEVLFELSRPETAYAFRLFRADMASNVNGEPKLVEVNPDTHLSFEPFNEQSELGLSLSVRPVAWNGIELHCSGGALDQEQLETWCIKWLDVNELGPKNEAGLLGAIHSVTAPQAQTNGSFFSVDFGSAPLRAFEELLQLLSQNGVTGVSLSSSMLGKN